MYNTRIGTHNGSVGGVFYVRAHSQSPGKERYEIRENTYRFVSTPVPGTELLKLLSFSK